MEWNFTSVMDLLKQGGVVSWIFSLLLALLLVGLIKGVLQTSLGHLRKLSEKTESKWDDAIVDCLAKTNGILIFIWTYFLLIRFFETSDAVLKFSRHIVIIATLLQFWLWGFNLIRHWKNDVLEKKLSTDASSAAAIGLLYTTLQTVFFITLILIGLSNLGIDIGALLAGLGVGGIAVALAAQNVLGDLLASLSIVLDKPFVLGDFIVVGNEKGVIEYIGLKTTRLRSISGEELIFSNKDLLESRIQNHKRMWKRRVVNTFGVIYSTPIEQIEKIPTWIKDIILCHPQLTLDRCNFINFGSSSLDFEYVLWMNSPDYNLYLEIQQKVNLEIMRKFKQENIEFAYNTQTLYITPSATSATSTTANPLR